MFNFIYTLSFFLYAQPRPPDNHPILLLTTVFHLTIPESKIKVLDHINHPTILTMYAKMEFFLYDCPDLHKPREGTMELLHSLCSSHTPIIFWDFNNYWTFYSAQHIQGTSTSVQKSVIPDPLTGLQLVDPTSTVDPSLKPDPSTKPDPLTKPDLLTKSDPQTKPGPNLILQQNQVQI